MNKNQKKKVKDRKLSEEEVRHIARLANLTLTNEEVKKFQKQLRETLDFIEILSELDTKVIEPTSQVTCLKNIVREDVSKPSISQNDSLSGTKSKFNNFFKIKAVIEK